MPAKSPASQSFLLLVLALQLHSEISTQCLWIMFAVPNDLLHASCSKVSSLKTDSGQNQTWVFPLKNCFWNSSFFPHYFLQKCRQDLDIAEEPLNGQTRGWSLLLGRRLTSSLLLCLLFRSLIVLRVVLSANSWKLRPSKQQWHQRGQHSHHNLPMLQCMGKSCVSAHQDQLWAVCKVQSRNDFKLWGICHIFISNCFRSHL